MIALSGGFDPLHVGHVSMIAGAAHYGNVLILLNSDAWLMRKKGYVFMSWEDRREILMALEKVQGVLPVDDADGTVCAGLELYHKAFDIKCFGNGGDRNFENTPEVELCKRLGIQLVWGLGAGRYKSVHSSDLVKKICQGA